MEDEQCQSLLAFAWTKISHPLREMCGMFGMEKKEEEEVEGALLY